MTVVNPDSISGITSVTSSGTTLEFYDVNGNKLNVSADLTGSFTVGTGATINSPADNTIDFETNGAERVRITSTGVVSINDSTPETFATLQVKNHTGASAAQILLHGADQAQIIMRDETGGSNQKCTTLRNDEGTLKIGTHMMLLVVSQKNFASHQMVI